MAKNITDISKQINYLNKIVLFEKEAGCIPKGSMAYCYKIEGEYVRVSFKEDILGMQDFKIHINVILKSCKIVS